MSTIIDEKCKHLSIGKEDFKLLCTFFDEFPDFGGSYKALNMPVILLERIPLPSLQTYTSVSVLVLSVALYYAYHTVTTVDINSIHELDFGDGVTVEPVADDEVLNEHHDMVNISLPYDSVGWNMFHILTSEVWCVWVGNTCIYRSTNS